MLLNYHTRRFVLGSLCVGDLVRLGLSSARVAGFTFPESVLRLYKCLVLQSKVYCNLSKIIN